MTTKEELDVMTHGTTDDKCLACGEGFLGGQFRSCRDLMDKNCDKMHPNCVWIIVEKNERLEAALENVWDVDAVLHAALKELARTWNGVGMLGKRDWTAAHLLARFQENTR